MFKVFEITGKHLKEFRFYYYSMPFFNNNKYLAQFSESVNALVKGKLMSN